MLRLSTPFEPLLASENQAEEITLQEGLTLSKSLALWSSYNRTPSAVLFQQFQTMKEAFDLLENPKKQNESALNKKLDEGQSAFYLVSTLMIALASAAVYFYSAEAAGMRYSDDYGLENKWFFEGVAPASSLSTNTMFDWIALIALWKNETGPISAVTNFLSLLHINTVKKFVAVFASVATIAPFFFLGFVGSELQKTLVGLSAVTSLPVFYKGSMNFYKYFHAPFIQRMRWKLREYACFADAREKYELATRKDYLVRHLKQVYQWFYHASEVERHKFMKNFSEKGSNFSEQLSFLLKHNEVGRKQYETDLMYIFSAYARFILFSGFGIIGLIILAQNFGHVVCTWEGIMTLTEYPILNVCLAIAFSVGNLIPGLGFCFSAMSNFDLISLLRKMVFLDIPRIQHIITGPSLLLIALSMIVFTVLRCYVFSGFSNDQVNWEGAIDSGASDPYALIFGLFCGIVGAIVFNGVPCEELFCEIMEQRVLSIGSSKDIAQVKYEIILREIYQSIENLWLKEYKTLEENPNLVESFAKFFPAGYKSLDPEMEGSCEESQDVVTDLIEDPFGELVNRKSEREEEPKTEQARADKSTWNCCVNTFYGKRTNAGNYKIVSAVQDQDQDQDQDVSCVF